MKPEATSTPNSEPRCACNGASPVVHDGRCETCVVRRLLAWCGSVPADSRDATDGSIIFDEDEFYFCAQSDVPVHHDHARLAVQEAAEERLWREWRFAVCRIALSRGGGWGVGNHDPASVPFATGSTKLIALYESVKRLEAGNVHSRDAATDSR